MAEIARIACRKTGCMNLIPVALAGEQLCLDHFLDEAFSRADYALARCREGRITSPKEIEQLLSDALAVVNNLEEQAADPNPQQRERMLDLLLILANVHECVPHQPHRPGFLA